jgi:hypothetical protein
MKIVFLSGLFLIIPWFATGKIIINEIAWMGAPVDGVDAKQEWRYEWIELYNVGDAAVGLDGWKVELHREDLDFEVALYGAVAAGEYFLIGASDKISGVDVNYASLAGKFVNAGQRVVLRNANGNIADEIDTKDGWFAGDNDSKLTMERRFADRDASDAKNWGTSLISGGTPKEKNSVFGKEAVLDLIGRAAEDTPSIGLGQEKKRSPWSLLFETITNKIFILAFLLSAVLSALILLFRRYLSRRSGEEFEQERRQ